MAECGNIGHSVKDSAIFHDYHCSECLNQIGTYTEAMFYCPECHTNLCGQCVKCGHDVIGRRNVDKWEQSSKRAQFDPCQKHSGNLIQLYCPKEDIVCCPVCRHSEHKSCEGFVYIPSVAKANENKAGLMKAKQDLGELHWNADIASKDLNSKLTNLDHTEQRLVADVKEFRARVNALLDILEKKSLDDIAQFKSLFKERYKSELDRCDTIKTEMIDLQNKLEAASTDEVLLFSRIKQANELVRNKNHLISDITNFENPDTAGFKPYTVIELLLKNLKGLGEPLKDYSVDKPSTSGAEGVKHSTSLCIGSHHVASNKPYRIVSKASFNVRIKQDSNKCYISGMCMMPSGHIILTDVSNKRLKKLSSQYEVTDSCSLTVAPRDVCHTEADQVAVALGDDTRIEQTKALSKSHKNDDDNCKGTVQLVAVDGSMTCTSSFSTDHDCRSLAYSNNALYITAEVGTAVYVYTLTGTKLRVITQDQHRNNLFSRTRCITSGRDGLHITDAKDVVTIDTSQVIPCDSMDEVTPTRGNLVSRCTSDDLRGGPFAISSDGKGCVFVGGFRSNNVLQVGVQSDKTAVELLSQSDDIDVQALCFDGVHARLLVSSPDSDNGHVLNLSK